MGPPLVGWQEKTATYRHGKVCCEDIATRLGGVDKAPKWTMGKRGPYPRAHEGPGPSRLDDVHRDCIGKFKRDPGYSMGKPPPPRPCSAPPGRQVHVPLKPTTPKYSFGGAPRTPKSEIPCGPGPGAYYVTKDIGGPKFSMPPRRGKKKEITPGPAAYAPLLPTSNHNTCFGDAPKKRPQSATTPGPNYKPITPRGPKYSFGHRREEAIKGRSPMTGIPYTQFGYNDFGRTFCDPDC
eukprot:gnl/MRDRNA2_/MRDRNA2_196756_c0_seq1.p1 gnl/MRDRNA2_/MRDRNA2_196756_c0~~gnl/MRDRNA2_/MRDRNA2_196756_c0_seq1.p1  ORF type:complete len:237 (-),score=37.54 gnl/MRDRNA2_/MRDRNA2_196756_c0_seq1:192-902(-)